MPKYRLTVEQTIEEQYKIELELPNMAAAADLTSDDLAPQDPALGVLTITNRDVIDITPVSDEDLARERVIDELVRVMLTTVPNQELLEQCLRYGREGFERMDETDLRENCAMWDIDYDAIAKGRQNG